MLTPTLPTIDYDDLIQEHPEFGFRVNNRLYQDEAIFQAEMDRIFHSGWVYVAHESEVPKPGDFIVRVIGRQPVVVVRGQDNKVRMFLNRCPHRGNTICQEQKGSSKFFRCAYHGWVFANTGELVESTHPNIAGPYAPDGNTRLFDVPRIGVHRGFMFASLASAGVSFEQYLGRAADYISRYCDLAPDGEIVVSAGRHGVVANANWKMQLENLVDAYHAEFVHATALAQFASMSSQGGKAEFTERGDLEDQDATMRDLGGGHTVLDNFKANRKRGDGLKWTGSTGTLAAPVLEGVAKRVGSREKAEWLARGGPCHIMVFPNLMLLWDAVRIIQPVSLYRTHVYYYPALLKGAPPEINFARIRAHEAGCGPAGFLAPDDMEMFERSQVGIRANPDAWFELNRGLHDQRMEEDDFGVPALTSQSLGETVQRGIWRHYKEIMSAD